MEQLSETQIQNYTLIQKVGDGATANVILAKRNSNKTLCAIKMIQKTSQFDPNELKCILQERKVFSAISHPFFVKMDQAFQTRNHFCLVLEYCPGGDLYNHLYSTQTFNENKVSLYAAQLILALEYLHSQNIIFRDLKPENILIGKDGYLKLTDFGLSSKLSTPNLENENSYVCGTFEYTAPQTLERNEDGKAIDWWSLGCCLYELIYQVSPFYSDNKDIIKENILLKQPMFSGKTSSVLRDLIRKLLTKDPIKRMEFVQKIKTHRLFEGINFEKLQLKEYPMPYVPEYTRGKKMVKVIKEDVELFTKLSDEKTPEETYVRGFDFNYEGLEEKQVSSQDESDQKNEKVSTEDEEDPSYKNVFEQENMWDTEKFVKTL